MRIGLYRSTSWETKQPVPYYRFIVFTPIVINRIDLKEPLVKGTSYMFAEMFVHLGRKTKFLTLVVEAEKITEGIDSLNEEDCDKENNISLVEYQFAFQ
jgi:hypothetical protein